MLPTFVIGLREGLEAALIVGIIAAFLRKQGRRDLLRSVLIGVSVAVALCLGVGIALREYSANLPQRQQEGLETVIGALAVVMVTYMVVWMRRNSRRLKGQLEGLAADALTGRSGAGRAMVLMAFLAVIREGFETVVFLLAAFNEAGSNSAAGAGLVLGLGMAIALGYGIYRGGVRLNLSKFFRATGLVLVLVAAGLVVNALHTAHEAGWLNIGQGATVDLSRIVTPNSVQQSLLTGMLGVQSRPVVIEVIGWLLYLLPVGMYVAWPPGRSAPTRTLIRGGAALAVAAALASLVLVSVLPGRPAKRPATVDGTRTAQVLARSGDAAVVRTQAVLPVTRSTGDLTDYRLRSVGLAEHGGVSTEVFRATVSVPGGTTTRPTSVAQVAQLNGGHLPLGLAVTGGALSLTSVPRLGVQVWLDVSTDRVVDVSFAEQVTATVTGGGRTVVLSDPLASATSTFAAATVRAAAADVWRGAAGREHRALLRALVELFAALAVGAAAATAGIALVHRRVDRTTAPHTTPTGVLVRS